MGMRFEDADTYEKGHLNSSLSASSKRIRIVVMQNQVDQLSVRQFIRRLAFERPQLAIGDRPVGKTFAAGWNARETGLPLRKFDKEPEFKKIMLPK